MSDDFEKLARADIDFIAGAKWARDEMQAEIEQCRAFILKWLAFEQECIDREGPYVSSSIPDLMNEARKSLAGET